MTQALLLASKSETGRRWPTARIWLLLYLTGVVGITFLHHPALLGTLLCIALTFSRKLRWHCLRRAIYGSLTFNLAVSAGYAVVAIMQGTYSTDYLLLLNLRVILLMYLGFWFVARVNLLEALSGWRIATLLAALAVGQIKVFERILNDFRAAFESRNLARPRWRDRTRHAASQVQTLLDKSIANSNEAALAMRSRGVFDD